MRIGKWIINNQDEIEFKDDYAVEKDGGETRDVITTYDTTSEVTSWTDFLTNHFVSGTRLGKWFRDFKEGCNFLLHLGSIVNNCTTEDDTAVLSATQGKVLMDLIELQDKTIKEQAEKIDNQAQEIENQGTEISNLNNSLTDLSNELNNNFSSGIISVARLSGSDSIVDYILGTNEFDILAFSTPSGGAYNPISVGSCLILACKLNDVAAVMICVCHSGNYLYKGVIQDRELSWTRAECSSF